MRVLGVIPARYASSRFPGKPLAEIGGAPMIRHVYARARQAQCLTRLIVATDDARIAEVVRAFGGEVRMTSPAHRSGTDRVAEAARGIPCDLVVNIQGDEPLLPSEMIGEAVEPFTGDAALRMGTVCRRLEDPRDLHDPHVVKVVRDTRGFALYFSRSAIPWGTDGSFPLCWKHIGLYVFRPDALQEFTELPVTPLERSERLEQLRALEHGWRIRVVETVYDSIGVDTPEDLERVREKIERERVTM